MNLDKFQDQNCIWYATLKKKILIAITWTYNTVQITFWSIPSSPTSGHVFLCFVFLKSFNPSVPNFLYSGSFPSSLHHCLSAISPSCVCVWVCVSERGREHNHRDSSFPYMWPILSLWFSACLFLGFLEGQHICGKTKQPRAATSPLGIVTNSTQIQDRKDFVCLFVCLVGVLLFWAFLKSAL